MDVNIIECKSAKKKSMGKQKNEIFRTYAESDYLPCNDEFLH